MRNLRRFHWKLGRWDKIKVEGILRKVARKIKGLGAMPYRKQAEILVNGELPGGGSSELGLGCFRGNLYN